MNNNFLCICLILGSGMFAQEHFAGINTSRRTGLLNASLNPAELVNLTNQYEVNVLNVSANVSNNKITFGDLTSGKDFEDLIFAGGAPVNLRADVDIMGPGFGFKIEKWAFAITSSAKVKANIVDVDVDLGNALTLSGVDIIRGSSVINNNYNQRVAATTWGEIDLSAAREVYNDGTNKFSAGVSFNLLFPGSYANIGADRFQGTISYNDGDPILTDADANLNFAYSGSLANGFTDSSNFTDFFAGGLNGFSTDIGFNYQWLDREDNDESYKLNAGLSFKNLGSMTFKDANNVSNNYKLSIQGNESLNLSQFDNVDNIEDIESILLQSGYLSNAQSTKDFKVKLPAMLAAYVDYKVYGNWFVSGYIQQKLEKDEKNTQIALQNITTITPRYSTKSFEAYIPISVSEIAGFTAGIGFRLGGFFIGSGSILSAAVANTNQADAYIGFRFGI